MSKVSTGFYKANHGVITNVEFLALAIMRDPGQPGAYYRRLLLASLGRPFSRGYYCSYFESSGGRPWLDTCYGDTHWENRSEGRHGEWYLTENHGLRVAARGHQKLQAWGLEFEDLLP